MPCIMLMQFFSYLQLQFKQAEKLNMDSFHCSLKLPPIPFYGSAYYFHHLIVLCTYFSNPCAPTPVCGILVEAGLQQWGCCKEKGRIAHLLSSPLRTGWWVEYLMWTRRTRRALHHQSITNFMSLFKAYAFFCLWLSYVFLKFSQIFEDIFIVHSNTRVVFVSLMLPLAADGLWVQRPRARYYAQRKSLNRMSPSGSFLGD